MDIPCMWVAATPRRGRGSSVEAGRGDAAAGTWIFRGGGDGRKRSSAPRRDVPSDEIAMACQEELSSDVTGPNSGSSAGVGASAGLAVGEGVPSRGGDSQMRPEVGPWSPVMHAAILAPLAVIDISDQAVSFGAEASGSLTKDAPDVEENQMAPLQTAAAILVPSADIAMADQSVRYSSADVSMTKVSPELLESQMFPNCTMAAIRVPSEFIEMSHHCFGAPTEVSARQVSPESEER